MVDISQVLSALGYVPGGGGGGGGLPSGGSAGQVLVKQSATSGDASWAGIGNGTSSPSAGAHAWWRVKYVSGNHASFLSAFDIQFRQVAGVAEHPSGGTAIEAHTRGGFAVADAFDGSDTTRWALDDMGQIANAYVGYHYAAPISVAQVRMLVTNGETPNTYNIQYSDDGVTWTTALAVGGQTNWATEVLHNMPATVSSYGLVIPRSYHGARVVKTANQTIPANTNTALTWGSASRDTNGFWSSGASSRLTIPAGVTKVRLRGSYWTHDASVSQFGCFFWKNGAAVEGSASLQTTGGNWAFRSVGSDVIDCVAGDYFEFVVFITGSGIDVWPGTDTWFALEVVEGSVLDVIL